MNKTLRRALTQVANYLYNLQEDILRDAQEDSFSDALSWAEHGLESRSPAFVRAITDPLAAEILRAMIEWQDFYGDHKIVDEIAAKRLMPLMLDYQKDAKSGERGFHALLDSIVQNMQVRGKLDAKTSYGRMTEREMRFMRVVEEWAYVMWKECQRIWVSRSGRNRR